MVVKPTFMTGFLAPKLNDTTLSYLDGESLVAFAGTNTAIRTIIQGKITLLEGVFGRLTEGEQGLSNSEKYERLVSLPQKIFRMSEVMNNHESMLRLNPRSGHITVPNARPVIVSKDSYFNDEGTFFQKTVRKIPYYSGYQAYRILREKENLRNLLFQISCTLAQESQSSVTLTLEKANGSLRRIKILKEAEYQLLYGIEEDHKNWDSDIFWMGGVAKWVCRFVRSIFFFLINLVRFCSCKSYLWNFHPSPIFNLSSDIIKNRGCSIGLTQIEGKPVTVSANFPEPGYGTTISLQGEGSLSVNFSVEKWWRAVRPVNEKPTLCTFKVNGIEKNDGSWPKCTAFNSWIVLSGLVQPNYGNYNPHEVLMKVTQIAVELLLREETSRLEVIIQNPHFMYALVAGGFGINPAENPVSRRQGIWEEIRKAQENGQLFPMEDALIDDLGRGEARPHLIKESPRENTSLFWQENGDNTIVLHPARASFNLDGPSQTWETIIGANPIITSKELLFPNPSINNTQSAV